eukprot:scaffold56375_cov19-Tisochrysis_lutea.AAC.1
MRASFSELSTSRNLVASTTSAASPLAAARASASCCPSAVTLSWRAFVCGRTTESREWVSGSFYISSGVTIGKRCHIFLQGLRLWPHNRVKRCWNAFTPAAVLPSASAEAWSSVGGRTTESRNTSVGICPPKQQHMRQ